VVFFGVFLPYVALIVFFVGLVYRIVLGLFPSRSDPHDRRPAVEPALDKHSRIDNQGTVAC